MMDMSEITAFFGWCTVINMSVLIFAALCMTVFKRFIMDIHSKLLGIDALELPILYFKYMANYKIGVLIFNLAPYIALKLMV